MYLRADGFVGGRWLCGGQIALCGQIVLWGADGFMGAGLLHLLLSSFDASLGIFLWGANGWLLSTTFFMKFLSWHNELRIKVGRWVSLKCMLLRRGLKYTKLTNCTLIVGGCERPYPHEYTPDLKLYTQADSNEIKTTESLISSISYENKAFFVQWIHWIEAG